METKDIILELRTKKGMSQDELAEKVFVTRQAVSRWENGETTPNTETLKLLSKLFDVSINTLLGSPRQLICQCCGMPLEDSNISKETDGVFNEEYCKWCYADGEYMYHDMDELIEVCVQNMANEHFSSEQARAYMKDMLPKLNYWKQYKNLDGAERFEEFKQQLINEFNDLHIEGMPKVEKLNALVGGYVNLEYRLPNGKTVKFLQRIAVIVTAFLRVVPVTYNHHIGLRGLHYLEYTEVLLLHTSCIHTAAHAGILTVGLSAMLTGICPTERCRSGIKIVAVCVEGDKAAWEKFRADSPKEWLHVFDASGKIKSENLYDLRTLPRLYLLDEQKTVLLKNTKADDIEQYLVQIIQASDSVPASE